MKSTTPERLALCRAVQPPPGDVRSTVVALWRVTHMRVRLMRYLVVKGGWPVAGAKAFVVENGDIWR